MKPAQLVTLADIADLAQVKRPTVSNWRRRHENFPQAVGGSSTQPEFHALEVAEWLDNRPLLDRGESEHQTYGDVFRTRLELRVLGVLRGALDGDTIIRLAVALAALWTLKRSLATSAQEISLQAARVETTRPDLAGAFTPLLADLPEPAVRLIPAVDLLCRTIGPAKTVELFISSADQLGATLRTFQTPQAVIDLVAHLVGKPGARSVCDPAAGTGGLLLGVVSPGATGNIAAADIREASCRMLRHRALCHGVALTVFAEDSFDEWPGSPAEVIVLDPPFVSGEYTTRSKKQQGAGPLDWVRLALGNLVDGGQAYVVVPTWVLSQQDAIEDRRWLVQNAALTAVIQLPRRVQRFRTGTELALLVLGVPGTATGVVLCDADKLARRHGDTWSERAALAVREPARVARDECRLVSADELKLAQSWLPAHKLAPVAEVREHSVRAVEAQQSVYELLGDESWVRALGVVEARFPLDGVAAPSDRDQRRLREVAEILAGHRLPAEQIAERRDEIGLAPIIGPDELRGDRPYGSRGVDLLVVADNDYKRTEAGDIVVLAENGVRTYVDRHGGGVVLSPAQIVRPMPDVAGPLEKRVPPRLLSRLLSAPRNASRETGSTVRRVSLSAMVVPVLTPVEMLELENYLAELDERQAKLRAKLDALETLDRVVSAGVADGALRVAPIPSE
ncbi:N-6 DNA methylase [Amycolatopsis oliviviridis]|uniref:site-specific DNA-methyltransferase (adenine-specific) n=1 Tax=Amycolatopsis oliviviridis TaxID=1471590 RepID=A0ABQ3LR58_9PSEU|nr:N-6 DNA methylase [Amycolatopsis oliviviridis]GHH22948.1 type II restriction endonuclease subunit M [Amycolatopsis oliviviridis]